CVELLAGCRYQRSLKATMMAPRLLGGRQYRARPGRVPIAGCARAGVGCKRRSRIAPRRAPGCRAMRARRRRVQEAKPNCTDLAAAPDRCDAADAFRTLPITPA